MTIVAKGRLVEISYDLLVEGRLVKSVGVDRPFRFVYGKKHFYAGVEKRIAGLKAGDTREFDLPPREGYGTGNAKSIMEIDRARFPKSDHFVGKQLHSKADGQYIATVRAVKKGTLVLDFNHPLAGKKLHFTVRVVSVRKTSQPRNVIRRKR